MRCAALLFNVYSPAEYLIFQLRAGSSKPDLLFAKSLGLPIVMQSRSWFIRVMQDQNQSAPYLCSGCGQMHRWPTRHNDRRAVGPADLYAIRGFEACLAGNRVPGFGT